jgi:hypothetical protein
MNRFFHTLTLALGVIAFSSEASELATQQHGNAPITRSRLSQIVSGDVFRGGALKDLPADIIPEVIAWLDKSRDARMNDPYTRDTTNIESVPMIALALKLEQHRLELLERDKPLYDQAVESLVKSIDGRAGKKPDHDSSELLKLNDKRVQKALERSREATEKAAPRSKAAWNVFFRLQAANGGDDPDSLPDDFEQQVDTELARMLAAGEVEPYRSAMTGLPRPPSPGDTPVALAAEAVKTLATPDSWNPWQWTALGGITALAAWAVRRRLTARRL